MDEEAETQVADEATNESDVTVDVACGNQGAVCDALLEWSGSERLAETVSWLLTTPVKIVVIVLAAFILNRLARRLVRRTMDKVGEATAKPDQIMSAHDTDRAEQRAETIGSLLRSASTAVIWSIAGIMVIEALGMSIVPVIASAGILGLAIGFGAQSVVEDLLRGVFMLAEDQFGEGDRIDIGVIDGVVERVTLRTVVLRDDSGTVWHVPNSEISRVANESQLRSRAAVVMGVSYTADLQRAMSALSDAAEEATKDPEWADVVRSAPEVQGIHELGEDSVGIRVIVWVAADDRKRFERYLRLTLKEALDRAEVEMPNRQVDVWLRGQPQAV